MCRINELKIEEAIACTSLACSDWMVYVARSRGFLSDFRQTLDLDIKNTIFSSRICRSLQKLRYSILCKYSFEFSTSSQPLNIHFHSFHSLPQGQYKHKYPPLPSPHLYLHSAPDRSPSSQYYNMDTPYCNLLPPYDCPSHPPSTQWSLRMRCLISPSLRCRGKNHCLQSLRRYLVRWRHRRRGSSRSGCFARRPWIHQHRDHMWTAEF